MVTMVASPIPTASLHSLPTPLLPTPSSVEDEQNKEITYGLKTISYSVIFLLKPTSSTWYTQVLTLSTYSPFRAFMDVISPQTE